MVRPSRLGPGQHFFDDRRQPDRQFSMLGAKHLGVDGWLGVSSPKEQLFVELLARPHPGELEFDVAANLEP